MNEIYNNILELGEKTKETARDQTELKREFILEDSFEEITDNAAKSQNTENKKQRLRDMERGREISKYCSSYRKT